MNCLQSVVAYKQLRFESSLSSGGTEDVFVKVLTNFFESSSSSGGTEDVYVKILTKVAVLVVPAGALAAIENINGDGIPS